ncbi:MAG TPA: CHAT domain-containing protein, partial [Gemmatimonadaceae bacterium]|nr:CHAT domain-containing protein [Gemmatimonadaceae bacterium]
ALIDGPPLAPLAGARAEVRAIRAANPSTVMRLGPSATETSLRQLGTRTGDVLHIAAHGIVRAWDGRGAALVLAADGQQDGVLYAGEVAALTLRARLVVLSACSTDAGDLVRGEGVSGLTSAFLRSGAQAVVTSAWRVDDAGTARLMRDFYGALARGATTGGALRSAQRAARTRGDPPALWAAFRVVGNASLVPRLVADAN